MHAHLSSLHRLTLSSNEFGGRLVPVSNGGECILQPDESIIQGTRMATDPQGRYTTMQSVPFHREIYDWSPLCDDTTTRVNVIWHTHPCHVVDGVVRLAPPSVDDFTAHAILGNLRQKAVNGVINTYVVVAREGYYVYTSDGDNVIDIPHFNHHIDPPPNVQAQVTHMMDEVLMRFFSDFEHESHRFCQHYNLQTHHELDTFLQNASHRYALADFINNTLYMQAIADMGMICRFIPFTGGIVQI